MVGEPGLHGGGVFSRSLQETRKRVWGEAILPFWPEGAGPTPATHLPEWLGLAALCVAIGLSWGLWLGPAIG